MLDWTTIDTVLLDMDGTLLDLKFDTDFYNVHLPRYMHRKLDMSIDQAQDAIAALHQATRGHIDWYCTQHWSRTLNVELMDLKADVADEIAIKADTPEFLQWLAANDLDVRIVTNAHPEVLALKCEKARLADYIPVEKMTCSHEFGMAKEDVGFWHAYQAAYPFDPQRSLLVDDNIHVLTTASTYGVRHLVAPEKPDSNAPPIDTGGFTAIKLFRDLIDKTPPATKAP